MSSPASDGRPVAVVTGASAGIGAATARRLAAAGFRLVLGARRLDRSRQLAAELDAAGGAATGAATGGAGGAAIGATGGAGDAATGAAGHLALPLDVTDTASVEAFVAEIPDPCRVLVNNAGGARGLEPVAEADEQDWRWMWEVNVLGTLRMTQALLPRLIASGDGHVVTVTSIAAVETYDGGAGYTAAKHAQGALHRTLRGELLGRPVRLTEVLPGMVHTDFSMLRFGGDAERAEAVYRGVTPLTADDVADVIAFAVTRPPHVNIDQIVLKPRDQASASRAHRRA